MHNTLQLLDDYLNLNLLCTRNTSPIGSQAGLERAGGGGGGGALPYKINGGNHQNVLKKNLFFDVAHTYLYLFKGTNYFGRVVSVNIIIFWLNTLEGIKITLTVIIFNSNTPSHTKP